MRPRIFRHFGLKILSVVLATLIWMLVAGQREAERSLRVPLEYRNIPEQLEMLGDPTSLVDVRLRGTSGALAQLRGTDLVAVIDLKGARSGRRLFHILSTDVAAPTGVKVLQISPATLSLTFETSAVKTVPVVPDIDDQPAAGYEIVKVTATPSTVDISGPTSEVEGVTEATTEPVSVAGATTSLIDTVTAGVADANVRLRLCAKHRRHRGDSSAAGGTNHGGCARDAAQRAAGTSCHRSPRDDHAAGQGFGLDA